MKNNGKEKLSGRKLKAIAKILLEEFAESPQVKAAKRLNKLGVTSYELWLFEKTQEAIRIPDPFKVTTWNELRYIEIKKGAE